MWIVKSKICRKMRFQIFSQKFIYNLIFFLIFACALCMYTSHASLWCSSAVPLHGAKLALGRKEWARGGGGYMYSKSTFALVIRKQALSPNSSRLSLSLILAGRPDRRDGLGGWFPFESTIRRCHCRGPRSFLPHAPQPLAKNQTWPPSRAILPSPRSCLSLLLHSEDEIYIYVYI